MNKQTNKQMSTQTQTYIKTGKNQEQKRDGIEKPPLTKIEQEYSATKNIALWP